MLLGACSQNEPDDAAPRSVILISIDTLRPDHLGLYGYDRPTSPTLDRLGQTGVVFEDVTSPAPWTLPAHGSLLTGLYPSRHGLKSHERYLPSHIPTLASLLSGEGWVTAAVVNSYNLSPNFGLDRGFQFYLYVEETADQIEPTSAVTDQAMSWLSETRDRPFFLFMHYYDVHTDYRSLPRYEQDFVTPYEGIADGTTSQLIDFREGRVALGKQDAPHLVDLYDAGIRQMDDELERFFSFLKENSIWDRCLVIVTSDHGEEFFERGDFLHGRTQFQEVIRVPLVIRGPRISGPKRISTPVSLVDIVPTVLSSAGLTPPVDIDGIDLSTFWKRDETGPDPRFLFGEADHNNEELDITRSVRFQNFKLHYNRLTQVRALYDLQRDPGERTDVQSGHPAEAENLMSALRIFMEAEGIEAPTRVLSPEEVEKLRSLGYIR
jgi:arylsulfatase A-like enzyme